MHSFCCWDIYISKQSSNHFLISCFRCITNKDSNLTYFSPAYYSCVRCSSSNSIYSLHFNLRHTTTKIQHRIHYIQSVNKMKYIMVNCSRDSVMLLNTHFDWSSKIDYALLKVFFQLFEIHLILWLTAYTGCNLLDISHGGVGSASHLHPDFNSIVMNWVIL
jgi:hypothetical protein